MGIIGNNVLQSGTNYGRRSDLKQAITWNPQKPTMLLTPKVEEEVFRVGVYINSACQNAEGINFQIYDVTNGVGDCVRVGGNFTIAGDPAAGWKTYDLTDDEIVKLTAGQTYGLGWKFLDSTDFFYIREITNSFNCKATHATLNGTDAWPSSWAGSLTSVGILCAYAETRIHTATRIEIEKYG